MSRDGFLQRWSRRKLARTDEPAETNEPGPELDHAPGDLEPVAEAPDEETLDEAELARLPPLESFTLKTDLAPFLRKGVPHALRNAAMRKMWMLDPAIRDHKDLAVDYAWDWNVPGGVPGNSGAISRDSLARMLESLNPKPQEPETAASEPVDESPRPAAGMTEPPTDARPQRPPPTPISQDAPDRIDAIAPEETRASEPLARPRRHGGAAPV